MKTKTLIPFLAMTFRITWGLAALLMLLLMGWIAICGEMGMTNAPLILS